MKRVEKGETYWFIDFSEMYAESCKDLRWHYNDTDYAKGNYFLTEEEAETMARKLRAVLNGAEVIEMPSNEIIVKEGLFRYNKTNDLYCAFKNGVDWLKSKIVK